MKKSKRTVFAAVSVAAGLTFGRVQKMEPARGTEVGGTWKADIRVHEKRVSKETIAMRKGSSKQVGISLGPMQSGADIIYQCRTIYVSGRGCIGRTNFGRGDADSLGRLCTGKPCLGWLGGAFCDSW